MEIKLKNCGDVLTTTVGGWTYVFYEDSEVGPRFAFAFSDYLDMPVVIYASVYGFDYDITKVWLTINGLYEELWTPEYLKSASIRYQMQIAMVKEAVLTSLSKSDKDTFTFGRKLVIRKPLFNADLVHIGLIWLALTITLFCGVLWFTRARDEITQVLLFLAISYCFWQWCLAGLDVIRELKE